MRFAQHTRALILAAMIALGVPAGGVVLAACGDDDQQGDSGSAAATKPVAGNGTDRAFVEDMTPHHTSAVEMANIARERGQSTFVKSLAKDIISTQTEELTTLKSLSAILAKAGVGPGDLGLAEHEMGMDMDMDSLKTATPFDRAFIDMMVPHHQGAIRMARVELTKGRNPQAERLAKQIIAAQSREIVAMNEHRQATFGSPSPAGGVPDEASAPSSAPSKNSDDGGGMSGMDHGG